MKPNFALDLSHEGINLLHRSKGGWSLVGSVDLDDPNMGARLEELRRSAAMLESGGFTTKIIIPDSQILYTTLAAPGPDDIAREVQIRAALDGLTPYPVGELVFDWRAQGEEARVAVLARETMDEAENFAVQHKFNPVSFVSRPSRGEFSGEPFFGKTRASARILPPGERIEPDSSPVPRNPRAKELPEEARVDLPVEDDIAQDEVETWTDEPDAAPEPATYDPNDPFAELDKIAAELSGTGRTDDDLPATNAPKPASRPRRKRGTDAPRVEAPQLAPFPPTPDEVGDTPMPTPRPFMPKPDKDKAEKAATPRSVPPAPPAREAPEPMPVRETPVEIDEAPIDEPAEVSGAASEPSVSFSSSRATPSGTPAEADAAPSRGRLAGVATRIGIGSRDGKAQTPSSPEATSAASAPAAPRVSIPSAPPPLGSGDRLRSDMADALAKPLPRPGDKPTPEPKAPGLLSRASGGAKAALAARAEQKAARQAEAAEAALANKIPPAPAPKESDTEPPRAGLLGSRRGRGTDEVKAKTRSSEAEAMTVFGARRMQSTRNRPKYLGLILTLALLLLMAAIAVWSTFLVDDGQTSLFNPGPATTTEPETATAEPEAAAPDAPATAEVLSPEAAEARYAATGIWQRAPETPNEPETTRLEPFELANLDPGVDARAATPLPEPASDGTRDAALADPVPPPPPGTTFDLNTAGLVVATPDGALSPTGILVYSGPPAVVPPAPPAELFPATATVAPTETVAPAAVDAAVDAAVAAVDAPADTGDAADAQPADAVAAVEPLALPDVPRTRPAPRPAEIPPLPATDTAPADTTAEPVTDAVATDDNAALTGPAARPEDTAPVTDTAAIDAAVDDVVAAAFADATDLAVPASVIPSARPANFERIVTSARASASDGSAVIAAVAPATVTAAIPTSASVATRATTENALNLRKINLIGIYGSSGARRALVRLENGRYTKVEVGDRLDGGQVTSISASKLTYQKGSRAYTLEVLPLG